MKAIDRLLLLITAFVVCSCTTDLVEDAPQCVEGKYVYDMQFEGDMSTYDDASTRASKTWTSGTVVYVYNNNSRLGYAEYDGSTWTFTAGGALSGSGSCKAVHIDDITSTSSSTITLDAQKAVYEGSGTWSVSGKSLTLNVNLSPSLGRLRLKGSSGTSVSLNGLKTYTSFDASSGTFASTTDAVNTSVQSSGYTPYLYGSLSGSTISTNDYTMTCPSGMMKAGTSGWVNYPTSASHTGWWIDKYNGHEYVDLGLPSGLRWATCNVGASKPEEYGGYYAWGAIEEQTVYDWVHTPYQTQKTTSYSYVKFTKYLGSTTSSYKDSIAKDIDALKTILDLADDAAHINWGGSWRMPTKEEQDELRNKCTWTWGTKNGVNGYTVVGPNGNSLFLPAAGYRVDSSSFNVGSIGNYWSSSLYSSISYNACTLFFDFGDVGWGYFPRRYGQPVRPVCP